MSEVCRQLEISESSYYRWKSRYAGMEESAIGRLRELEKENARLRQIVADQAVDIQILKEATRGNY